MFANIAEYIKRSLEDRQSHLKLEEKCIEIGGIDSREFRGLLAHHLKTTIPTRQKIVLCHACHNHWCSNPNHMYWGTYSENRSDARSIGKQKSIWAFTVEKYGLEEAKRIAKRNGSKKKVLRK